MQKICRIPCFNNNFVSLKRTLLSHKETNVNHRNDQGGTALHFASAGMH